MQNQSSVKLQEARKALLVMYLKFLGVPDSLNFRERMECKLITFVRKVFLK